MAVAAMLLQVKGEQCQQVGSCMGGNCCPSDTDGPALTPTIMVLRFVMSVKWWDMRDVDSPQTGIDGKIGARAQVRQGFHL